LTRLIIVVSLVISVAVGAFQMKRESYIDIPSADFNQGLYFNVSSSYPIRSIDDVKFDPNFGIDFSYNEFGMALKWYDGTDFALDLCYRLLEENGHYPAVAVGISEIAIEKYVSPAGFGKVFNDENYLDRPPEVASVYVVATKEINENFDITGGIGRGKFVGYGPRSHHLNIDAFFDETHGNWAFGLFGGIKVSIPDGIAFIAEVDGRDLNLGVEYQNESVKGILAVNKLEQFVSEYELSPRVSLSLSYKINIKEKKGEVKEGKKIPLAIELIDNNNRESVTGNTVINNLRGDTVEVSANKIFHPFWLKPDMYIAHIKSEGYFDKKIELAVKGESSTSLLTIGLDKKGIPEKVISAEDSVVIVDNFGDVRDEVEGISIRFSVNRAQLTSRAHRILDRIVELISANEDVYLLIIGHTCSLGSRAANQKLSEQRAESVKAYLIERGIPADKITTEGYGETDPIADNSTEEGRIKNRRAEFILYRMRR
jgi:outer membrane protein OmpA-like peptidoglycan-associated protein